MQRHEKSKGKLAPVLGLLAVGIAIVGLTAYAIISLTAPPTPAQDEVGPAQNNTPFVGKKW